MPKKMVQFELTTREKIEETCMVSLDLPWGSQVVSAVMHHHDTRIFLWCECGTPTSNRAYHSKQFWVVPLGGIVPEEARFLNYVDIREGEAYAIYQAE
jgi:hypothetical protein